MTKLGGLAVLATVAAGGVAVLRFAGSGPDLQEQPDYYCRNAKTGDCYAHYPIFGPGCDQGYVVSYIPCQEVPTPTPTATVTPTPSVTPTPTPVPWQVGYLSGPSLEQSTNYVQGPSPVRRRDGSVALLHHQGYCCTSPRPAGEGWEDGVAWVYGLDGYVRAARLTTMGPDAHETAFFSGAAGLIAWTRTTWSSYAGGAGQNRGRICIARTDDYTMLASAQLDIINPWDEACSARGTCIGAGVLDPSLVRLGDDVLLFARDDVRQQPGAYPVLAKRIGDVMRLRSLAQTATTVVCWRVQASSSGVAVSRGWVAAFEDGNGTAVSSPAISDVGLGSDGRLYALASDWLWAGVEEWVSVPAGAEPLGSRWRPTGRRWQLSDGMTCWDGGYMRDDAGRIEEPRTIVAVAAPNGHEANAGTWRFVWFAEPGANTWWTRASMAPPPTPTPDPLAFCPDVPDLDAHGWWYDVTVQPNMGQRLVILGGSRGTCYYLRRITGVQAPAWERRASTGPWSVQSLWIAGSQYQSIRWHVWVPGEYCSGAVLTRGIYDPEEK